MRRVAIQMVALVALGWLVGLAMAAPNPTRAALDRIMPEMKFTGVTLRDALDFLRDVSGANFHVNWKAIEAAGVTPDTPVNLRLRSVSLRKVLDLLLTEAGAGDKLAFHYDGGVIEITTREVVQKILYTRVYPVEDLIMEIPEFDSAPELGLTATNTNRNNRNAQGQNVNDQGQGLFGNNAGTGTNRQREKVQTKNERAQALVDLIMAVIYPQIWQENGGTSSIRYWNGNLIVTAPRHVHEAIGGPME